MPMVAVLLASDWLPDPGIVHQLGRDFDARLGCAAQQSPKVSLLPGCYSVVLNPGEQIEIISSGSGLSGGGRTGSSNGDYSRRRTRVARAAGAAVAGAPRPRRR